MIVTKHISLDNDCISKMKPYVDRHDGNFSSAIREVIELSDRLSLPEKSIAVDMELFRWMLMTIDGMIIPDEILDSLIDPGLINSIERLEYYINHRLMQWDWKTKIIIKCDDDNSPSEVLIEIKGPDENIKFIGYLMSHFLIKNLLQKNPIKIKNFSILHSNLKIELCRSDKNDAINSLIDNFGSIHQTMQAIRKDVNFWKNIISRHVNSNYNMITVHRNYFEDIISDKLPLGEITIENIAKKPIKDIPLSQMLLLIKEVYETSRVVDRVEIDKDKIILFHNYRNKDAIEKLKKILTSLLEGNGHIYDARSTANMIVMVHRPDVGKKINNIVDHLKITNTGLDQELIMFITFLKGLENIPDIPISLSSLGRRIGIKLIQEYEIENKIDEWNLENFVKAFKVIDSKLHIESEWKIEKNTVMYTVKKCDIATSDGACKCEMICYTIREAFKGALYQAFKNKVQLEVKKLLTHGDDHCQVVIEVG